MHCSNMLGGYVTSCKFKDTRKAFCDLVSSMWKHINESLG